MHKFAISNLSIVNSEVLILTKRDRSGETVERFIISPGETKKVSTDFFQDRFITRIGRGGDNSQLVNSNGDSVSSVDVELTLNT